MNQHGKTNKSHKVPQESQTRTRHMQCVGWQLEIPGKPNKTTDILK